MFYNEKIFKRCFNYRGKYWYKNIEYIPLYFKQMHFLIKHGYDKYAHWETFNWFIDTMSSVLKKYRKIHYGYPWNMELDEWDAIIDRMIELLDLMDEDSQTYQDYEDYKKLLEDMNSAKDEFFELFSKYFYHLWD